MHWFDELGQSIDSFLRSKARAVCNAGLSVSGLQHVGRLRGEIILNHFIASHLRENGLEVLQHLVLYTQDPWKGSPGQLAQFTGEQGKAYVGWRLIDVPDPEGCHENWVDHFWEGFGESLESFADGVVTTRTTEIYKRPEMKEIVHKLVSVAEEVRRVVNRYRPRNPHPKGWLPFEPMCKQCHRIGQGRTLNIQGEEVEYECDCGDRGVSHMEEGKLNWRLEWPALWAVLQVDIEPFGKDHAAPGGSRESCKVISEELLRRQAPFGIPYEFVGYSEGGVDRGDMGSSDFLGFGPKDWLDLAEPEVLRFQVANVPVRRRIVLDLGKMDTYHQAYDQAEAAYYDGQETPDARSYSLSLLTPPLTERPYRLAYKHAALLAQVAPQENSLDWAVRRLEDTGLLQRPLTPFETDQAARRLRQALKWVKNYGPEDDRVQLLATLPREVREALTAEAREALSILRSQLESLPWREETVKDAMVELTGSGDLPLSTKKFFAALYTVFLGKPSGPRAAPLLVVLDKNFVLERLKASSS